LGLIYRIRSPPATAVGVLSECALYHPVFRNNLDP